VERSARGTWVHRRSRCWDTMYFRQPLWGSFFLCSRDFRLNHFRALGIASSSLIRFNHPVPQVLVVTQFLSEQARTNQLHNSLLIADRSPSYPSSGQHSRHFQHEPSKAPSRNTFPRPTLPAFNIFAGISPPSHRTSMGYTAHRAWRVISV
jgi:hypothetical protein